HRLDELALETEPREIIPDGKAAEVHEDAAQRWPHVALGGLLDGERLGEPGRRDVVAKLGDFALEGPVRGEIPRRKKREELPLRLGTVGAEQQIALPRRRQEVVRVPA